MQRALTLTALIASTVVTTAPLQAQSSSGVKASSFVAAEKDTLGLLSAARIAALSETPRAEWTQYVARSVRAQQTDRALLAGELATLGKTTMQRAAFLATSYAYKKPTSLGSMATDSARRLADAMLSYQTPSGGWSKHVDFAAGPRAPGQSFFSENESWQYIATVDNDATTSEIRFLMRAVEAGGKTEYRAAVARGVEYLLMAQFPNGCWPQVWPLQGGYHDAATFNDDAIVEVLQILDDVGRGAASYVPDSLKKQSAHAVERGVQCILSAQMRVNGTLTVWGQQHDPLTLDAVNARSYELRSLTSKESAGVVMFLMDHSTMDHRIAAAVQGAVTWFEKTAIHGMRSEPGQPLKPDAAGGDLWARMYEIGTNRPIFSNRDGIKQYEFSALTDRREGYGWYSDEPARVLKRYKSWVKNPTKAKTPPPTLRLHK